MTNEEISVAVLAQYAAIKSANERLAELRENICKHEESFEGKYSWRVGAMEKAIICKFCNKTLEFPDRPKF